MSLTEEQKAILGNEIATGRRAEQAYNLYVAQHISSTVENIYSTIEALSVTQKDELIELKGLLTAVRGLETSITRDIETGKLAALQLEGEK